MSKKRGKDSRGSSDYKNHLVPGNNGGPSSYACCEKRGVVYGNWIRDCETNVFPYVMG